MHRRARHLNPGSAGAVLALDSRFITGLSDGDPVSTWADRSGTANNATQVSSGLQPSFQTGEINGHPMVLFDGSTDYLNYATSVFSYTGSAHVFAVTAKVTSAVANNYGSLMSEWGAFSNGTMIAANVTVFPNAAMEVATDCYGPGGKRYNSTIASPSTPHILGWTWANWSTHKTNGNTRLSADGVSVTGAVYGVNPSGFSPTERNIGRCDTNSGSDNKFGGGMAYLVVIPTQVSLALEKRIQHAAAFSFKISCS